ncbi:hypothetical protein [Frankia sp. AgKG'84/4]|uniref:hypothetical protein n=1 Tax=Frankia sp. AgKG'84/4 TaxID=573490 RepID=UPI002029E0C6|nr:hypothetical protein [Frankia sp. AgKG'84/4]MCL9793857.1 hypothetical protein [Frankia sp. AgKG'84/4]
MRRQVWSAVLVAAVLAVGLAAAPPPARASTTCSDGQRAVSGPNGFDICVNRRRTVPVTPAASSAPVRPTSSGEQGPAEDSCPITSVASADVFSGTEPPSGPPPGAAPTGRWNYLICGENANPGVGAAAVVGAWVWTTAAQQVVTDPRQLAQQAYDELRPPTPLVDFRPRYHAGQPEATLVGLRTYVWVTEASLRTASKRVAIGATWAQVTDMVRSVTFDPGDGSAPVVCPDGGVPYDPAAAPDQQVASCWHVYTRPGSYSMRVSVTWAAVWTGSGGTGGTLPALIVTGNVAVPVEEVQSVNGAVTSGDRTG